MDLFNTAKLTEWGIDQNIDVSAINSAFGISQTVLRNAYNTHGINAGETHFSDVWIRDSAFAGWGALQINDTHVVAQFLVHALQNMNESGQCPLRIGQKYFLLKYIGLKGPQGPTYIEDKYISIPMDSNSLIIILFCNYIQHTNDKLFASTHYAALLKSLDWYTGYCHNHLIIEGPYAGWADSVKKRGHVLYTNVLYFKALNLMSEMAGDLGEMADGQRLHHQSQLVKKTIQDNFWNGNYLNDWIHGDSVKKTVSLDGNMLAILFDVVDNNQAKKIIDYIIQNKVITPYGCPVVYGKYTYKDVYPPFYAIGLSDYHNGLIWFWISCIASISFFKNNYKLEAIDLMQKMSKKICRDNTVYEVYTTHGQPVKRVFYKSEKGFAWSAGLFVWAYQTLLKHPK
jgi:glycogen debranching enzyme